MKVTKKQLFKKAVPTKTIKVRKLWLNLINGKDRNIHYIIALNKWFFEENHRQATIKEIAEYCDRSKGSTRMALNCLADRYNILNRTVIEGTQIYTPKSNHHNKMPLKQIFEAHLYSINSGE